MTKTKKKNKPIRMNSFSRNLDERYGRIGTPRRTALEKNFRAFIVGEMLREARRTKDMSQEELAQRIRTKKSYISRLENGKIDIQISTLYRILEEGLGRTADLIIK